MVGVIELSLFENGCVKSADFFCVFDGKPTRLTRLLVKALLHNMRKGIYSLSDDLHD